MKFLGSAAVAATLALVANPAQATVFIGLSTNGGATITTVATAADVATFNGAFGQWETNLVSSVEGIYPTLVTSTDHSQNKTGAKAAGTLDIYITRNNIEAPGATSMFSSFTTNVLPKGWSVRTRSYINTSNGLYGGTLMSDHLFTKIGIFTQQVNSPDPNGLFSVTGRYTVKSTSFGQSESSIALLAVPEPATWGLMIMGFGGAGAMLRSRRRSALNAAA